MSSICYDIVIIGGGPIGIACALEAKKNGVKYVILEKGVIANSLYHYPNDMTFFSTSEKLELDGIPFISRHPKPSKNEALEYYRRIVTSNHLNINLFEEVVGVQQNTRSFDITTSNNEYTSKHIIVATGFYDIPNYIGVKGENLPKVKHYYKDAHYYSTQNVVVVGASNSAVDAALEIYRKGGCVTMIVRGDDIGDRVKYWVRPDIVNRIEEGSIKAYFNSEIIEITEQDVVFFNDQHEKIRINNDFVLALTGYRPNFEFLKKLGVKLSEDGKMKPMHNEITMETNIKGIYLAGVICGGVETHQWFIENSRVHANKIINHIVNH